MLEANGATLDPNENALIASFTETISDQEFNNDTPKDLPEHKATTKGALTTAMAQMNERGEKLGELREKTADLQSDAQSYQKISKQLKLKMKQQEERKMFGLF